MWEHHLRTIDRLVQLFSNDPAFPALIVGGSLVKGYGRVDSDVDILLVATDEEYQRRLPSNALQYFNKDLCDYPGGYVDGKIVDVGFLEEAADHGSEPARAAFRGAYLAYSRLPELEDLLKRIPVYPVAEQAEKIRSFHAQLLALQWYAGEAEKLQDAYLMTHTVADLVLYGGRMILAYNQILYPYRKWFMTELRRAPQKPEGLLPLIDELLVQPTRQNVDRFCECILKFREWEAPSEGWPVRFMHDTEWTWRTGRLALADS